MTVREPEWTPDQVAWLLAARADAADVGSHGERISEATDPKASPFYKGPDPIRYEVVGPTVNQAEKQLEDAQETYYKKYPNASRNGHMWRVRRITSS